MTAADPDSASPAGVWIHAHEDDTPQRMVFRRTAGPLPPSRGRAVLVLNEDGSLGGTTPGPDDRPLQVSGSWKLDGPTTVSLAFSGKGQGPSVLELEGSDRMTVANG